jgi:hypothetical protein
MRIAAAAAGRMIAARVAVVMGRVPPTIRE